MRKLREVLRLRFELKLGYQQIGRSCSIGVSTVHNYLKRAEAAGVTWPLPEGWDEARVEAALFPRREPTVGEKNPARTPPDFAAIHEQLRSSKYVTLQLLWEEYRQGNPEGYRYSRFCELYQRWRSKLDVVLRQEHKAGEKMFVDCAGATIPVYDRHTGVPGQAPLFGPRWSPVPTPGPRPRAISRWSRGCVRTCTPLSTLAAFRHWPFRTTPRPVSPRRTVTIQI
jgi:hypothetical protein